MHGTVNIKTVSCLDEAVVTGLTYCGVTL